MVLAKGCKGEPGKRFINEAYLQEAYTMGKTLDIKDTVLK